MEILSYDIFEKEAIYKIENDGNEIVVELKFDLEENWEPGFDPGSYLGFYEKYSGKIPIDIEFSTELSDQNVKEIETHLGENYDCRKW